MAVPSPSPTWARSDVTADDPIWKREGPTRQVRYPPLRFLSRPSPGSLDTIAGRGVDKTSPGAVIPDDGSDFSVSSADTVVAATTSLDRLTNGMPTTSSEHFDKHSSSVYDIVNEECREECQTVPTADALRVSCQTSTDMPNGYINGLGEHYRTGSTSYHAIEHAESGRDSFAVDGLPETHDERVALRGNARPPIDAGYDRRRIDETAVDRCTLRPGEGLAEVGRRRAHSGQQQQPRRPRGAEVSPDSAPVVNAERLNDADLIISERPRSGDGGPSRVVMPSSGPRSGYNAERGGLGADGDDELAADTGETGGAGEPRSWTSPADEGVLIRTHGDACARTRLDEAGGRLCASTTGTGDRDARRELTDDEGIPAERQQSAAGDDDVITAGPRSIGGCLPEAAAGNGSGMLGMRCAGRGDVLVFDGADDERRPADSLKTMDGERATPGGEDDDEGIGPDVAAVTMNRSVAAVQAENASDNSSVDSDGTPYNRKKSALKNRSANRDDNRRAARKVRFAEPLVVRDRKPAALSAVERLGLSDGLGVVPLANGVVVRPRIRYVDGADDPTDDGGGRRPENATKPARFIVKKGPSLKSAVGTTRITSSVDNLSEQGSSSRVAESSQDAGTATSSTKSVDLDGPSKYDGINADYVGSIDPRQSGYVGAPERARQPEADALYVGRSTKNESSRDENVDRTAGSDRPPFSRGPTASGRGGASTQPEPGSPKKTKVTLSRSAPVKKVRPRSTQDQQPRRSSPVGGWSGSGESGCSGDVTLRRVAPERTWKNAAEIGYGISASNGDLDGNSKDGVPHYARVGRKVLPAPRTTELRRTDGAGEGRIGPRVSRQSPLGTSRPANGRNGPGAGGPGKSPSYEDVSGDSIRGRMTAGSRPRPTDRFSAVPELVVIPLQSDSPSVPSPVSGDSGISSSSSVTELGREQPICPTSTDSLTDNYSTLNYIRSDKTRAVLDRVNDTRAARDDPPAATAPFGCRRPVERDAEETPPANVDVVSDDAGPGSRIRRRTSDRKYRKGQAMSATEERKDGELGRWARMADSMIKDDTNVDYLTAVRQQNAVHSNRDRLSYGESQSDFVERQERRDAASSPGGYPASEQPQPGKGRRDRHSDQNTRYPPADGYGTSETRPEDENPYGHFIRSATNRKSTTAKLVPIPMDILNPRPSPRADPDNWSRLSNNDTWSLSHGDGGSDVRRYSNSSGYSASDVSSCGQRPPSALYPGRRSEPRFTSTAQIYALLREKSRNPFVKTDAYS